MAEPDYQALYQAERARREQAENLAQVTAQLHRQIQQYADELQAHNAELDAFAHTVAHDLNAPLSILIGLSNLLLDGDDPLPPEIQQMYLKKIAQQGFKMHSIIHEILLLASVRKAEVQAEPITNMAELVANALERISGLMEEHPAVIILPETWPLAVGYGPWVEEVWANYLSNAVKYGGRPPRLEVQATAVDGIARFGVQDNGIGLSEAEQARLFAPFTRLHQVRISGHGLGLSIVQRIMDKLDGRAGVASQPGQGSLFYFELPIAEV